MHVEVIGCTSAGKSSLVRGMLGAAVESGQDFVTGDDVALGRLAAVVGNEFVRRRLIDVPALIASVGAFRTHGELIRLVLRLSRTAPGGLSARLNLARNALRKIGLREIVTSRLRPGRSVLVDNEGVLQAAHNLFVHAAEAADLDDAALRAFLRLVPLPDVVVYRRQPEAELVARTLRRGHKRVPGGSPEAARRFVARAVRVFEAIAADPGVASRLVVLEAEGGARLGSETRTTAEIERLRAIVETGAELARARYAAIHPERAQA